MTVVFDTLYLGVRFVCFTEIKLLCVAGGFSRRACCDLDPHEKLEGQRRITARHHPANCLTHTCVTSVFVHVNLFPNKGTPFTCNMRCLDCVGSVLSRRGGTWLCREFNHCVSTHFLPVYKYLLFPAWLTHRTLWTCKIIASYFTQAVITGKPRAVCFGLFYHQS